MKPGDLVWSAQYGNVQRVKLVAIDDEEAVVRTPHGLTTTSIEELFQTKQKAIASTAKQCRRDFLQRIQTLKSDLDRTVDSLKKLTVALDAWE